MSTPVRIVLADDNDSVRECVRLLLIHLGYDVVAVDGGDALVRAVLSEHPDLIISDVQMPGVDGIAAVEAIRRADATPVVFISGGWDDANVARAARLDAAWRLTKPLQPPELVAAITAACGAAAHAPVLVP